MKSASPALVSLLAGTNELYMADLITITPLQSSAIRFTSADVNITNASSAYPADDGLVYYANIPYTRNKIKTVVGVEVDELELTIFGGTVLGSTPILQAAAGTYLDGAQVQVLRAFMSTFGVVVGSVIQFVGFVAQVDVGRTQAVVKVKSNLQLLNVQMPKNVWQPTCINQLYQSPCNLTRTAISGQPTTGTSGLIFGSTGTASSQATNYFNLGYVTFTSGANNGITRTVKSYSGGVFTMMNPFPNVPLNSDTFNAFVGCDHTLATCTSYGNQARFRGMPFIPPVSIIT